MKSIDPQRLDFQIDAFFTVKCMEAGKCLACGWKPRPEFASMYAEWRMHFRSGTH
jgi:hypothetical protein